MCLLVIIIVRQFVCIVLNLWLCLCVPARKKHFFLARFLLFFFIYLENMNWKKNEFPFRLLTICACVYVSDVKCVSTTNKHEAHQLFHCICSVDVNVCDCLININDNEKVEHYPPRSNILTAHIYMCAKLVCSASNRVECVNNCLLTVCIDGKTLRIDVF